MERRPFFLLACAALVAACAKEPQLYKARLTAKCRDCIVAYAGGSTTSVKDTLIGAVDEVSGDTSAEERSYEVLVKDGDNVFLRACRMSPDTAYGPIELSVGGEVRTITLAVDTSADCAEINSPTQPR